MSPSSPGFPLRLGVVGAGRFATFLTEAVADLPDVTVHVVTDQDDEAAQLLAKAYDARVAGSWQQVLGSAGSGCMYSDAKALCCTRRSC